MNSLNKKYANRVPFKYKRYSQRLDVKWIYDIFEKLKNINNSVRGNMNPPQNEVRCFKCDESLSVTGAARDLGVFSQFVKMNTDKLQSVAVSVDRHDIKGANG